MDSKKTTWVAGSVLLGVAIVALAWFVLIAPVLSQASTAASDTEAAEARNDALSRQLDQLAEQAANLATYEADKATLEKQIPTTGSTSDFLRTIDALAAAAPTAVVNVEIGAAEDVVPAVPAVAEGAEVTTEGDAAATDTTTTTDGTATDATATDGTATDATATDATTATGPAVIPGFIAIPVRVTALGNPLGVLNFLGAIQQQSERLMLVTGLEGTGQDESEASGGRPATAEGDLELVISGYIYVLQDPAAETADDAAETPAAPPATGDGTGAFSGA